ncbi:glycine cleavage system aminomethyltransferase GcvT [Novosphingobium album (ex Hu et al. 2023)]|uniref:aminomethyltransferase n=1 Tax=Novosphingobium album (ex Hu et al. 2023) TaxID=2930093 RepID=A0ABT0AYS0_9SPHN|nr:glycine cleavage system aminomethyltransferase GcvT [Novosphingobium album (ex Hu et al. 2023)]MCJ2177942.1 glycine cleavage system aminomethyltransferase GcvT [Novosphingobium album (ex Hu et al. 2023)]
MSEYPVNDDDQGEEIAPMLLPLDAWHRGKGGRMVEFAGYMMPVQYEGIMAEHLWTRESAGLFDVSHMGQIYVSGEGVEPALEAALPIDLSTLKTGSVRYSLLFDEEGAVLDDLMVTRWSTGFYLVVNGATKWDDIGTLRELLPDEVTLNHLDENALLALQGPKAFAALERHVDGDTPLSALTFMKGASFKLGGVDAWISRSGYTGEDGFEIAIPGEAAAEITELLCGEPEVKPIGLGARDSLRLEAGLPLYGHDMTPEQGAMEAGLAFGVNKRRRVEGGFPGAARFQRDFAEGTARKRIGLALEGRMAAREGAVVMQGNQQVGVVTSGGFSPSLQQPIAMAYVDAVHTADGAALEIEMRGKRLPAKVVPMPFVPHRYHR